MLSEARGWFLAVRMLNKAIFRKVITTKENYGEMTDGMGGVDRTLWNRVLMVQESSVCVCTLDTNQYSHG